LDKISKNNPKVQKQTNLEIKNATELGLIMVHKIFAKKWVK